MTFVVQRRTLALEAEREKQRQLMLEDGGPEADHIDSGVDVKKPVTSFRITTKVLAVAGIVLAGLHRHAVANGCTMKITTHFGANGCFSSG